MKLDTDDTDKCPTWCVLCRRLSEHIMRLHAAAAAGKGDAAAHEVSDIVLHSNLHADMFSPKVSRDFCGMKCIAQQL